MPTFTPEPVTGDLNARTESALSAVEYMTNKFEHTLIFNRRKGTVLQQVNLSLSHYDEHHELTLVVFNMEGDEPIEVAEQISFPFDESRLLRDFLNRSEISAILSQQH
jgi:hypothetical protein